MMSSSRYGNLGILVKVAPLGYSFYSPGEEAIVASHTLRASQMKMSTDQFSVEVAQHSLTMDGDHRGWRAVISDAALSYDLHFRLEGETYVVHDFGRATPQEQTRHRIAPRVSVTGAVTARGRTTRVSGFGSYVEAYYMHVKFTDLCNEFTNFQLRSADSSEVLLLMQYVPRAGTTRAGPRLSHGCYMKDGRVVAVCFQNESVALGGEVVRHAGSGYELPARLLNTWSGTTVEGKSFRASCAVETPANPSSTTDVLGMFPTFFRDIVSLFAGLPFVFCWRAQGTVAELEVDGVRTTLRGTSSTELTKVHRS